MDMASTSTSSVRTLHDYDPQNGQSSQASSPRSSIPDSPAGSLSSLSQSVSSSFFFSSAAASPPHNQSDHGRDSTAGLIIPSLTLPDALRRPTTYGQSLGTLRVLVVGPRGSGKSTLSGILLQDNEDIIEVGTWEDLEHGAVLHASTDWLEHRDSHGLERFEPSRNVEIVEVSGYDGQAVDAERLVQSLQSIVQTPFYALSEILDPTGSQNVLLASLVSSPATPLYTALILLLPSSSTSLEQLIIDTLGPQIPLIVLPRLPTSPGHHHQLSSFKPSSAVALRAGLFRSPETLATLRGESTDRFIRWREIERAVDEIHSARMDDSQVHRSNNRRIASQLEIDWNKAKWEEDWEATLSHDVAKRRNRAGTYLPLRHLHHDPDEDEPMQVPPSPCAFDPLHLPSLFMFSLSLLGPLKDRLKATLRRYKTAIALVGGLAVGMSFGILLKS